MGMINRRNAVLGWTAWEVGKRVARRKAKDAVPGRADDSLRPNKSAIAAFAAAVGGLVYFLRRRRDDSPTSA